MGPASQSIGLSSSPGLIVDNKQTGERPVCWGADSAKWGAERFVGGDRRSHAPGTRDPFAGTRLGPPFYASFHRGEGL